MVTAELSDIQNIPLQDYAGFNIKEIIPTPKLAEELRRDYLFSRPETAACVFYDLFTLRKYEPDPYGKTCLAL